jgi:hypothetical protein
MSHIIRGNGNYTKLQYKNGRLKSSSERERERERVEAAIAIEGARRLFIGLS